MSCLLEKFVNRVDFESYEDFVENFQLNIPENFNFAYDADLEFIPTPDEISRFFLMKWK